MHVYVWNVYVVNWLNVWFQYEELVTLRDQCCYCRQSKCPVEVRKRVATVETGSRVLCTLLQRLTIYILRYSLLQNVVPTWSTNNAAVPLPVKIQRVILPIVNLAVNVQLENTMMARHVLQERIATVLSMDNRLRYGYKDSNSGNEINDWSIIAVHNNTRGRVSTCTIRKIVKQYAISFKVLIYCTSIEIQYS